MSFEGEEAVLAIRNKTRELLNDQGRVLALRYAMQASGELLAAPSDPLRQALRHSVFQVFANRQVSYQGNDFEVVDYDQYEMWPDTMLLRGPSVPEQALAKGDYFCVIGAAQTFGRLARHPWPVKLGKALGLAPLNLSRGGAGPDVFLDPRMIALANGARFVILQAMSGRSTPRAEYPGSRIMTVDGEVPDRQRRDVLKVLWNESRAKAIEQVGRWNATYLSIYRQLREAINRPTLLLWCSGRKPEDWSSDILRKKLHWGTFPQLVGAQLYGEVAELFDEQFQFVKPLSSELTTSRITNAPCPYFGQGREFHTEIGYYPTQRHHRLMAQALLEPCEAMLARQ